MDLLVHLRQTSCGLARDRCFAGHQAWIETDLMFAPYLLGSCDFACRLGTIAQCTLERTQSVPIAVDCSRSLASRWTRSSTTCSLGRCDTAQQTLDLQMTLQTDARCRARMVSSNLAVGNLAVYHPLTAGDLVAGAMQGSRSTKRPSCCCCCCCCVLAKTCILWTCYARE